MCTFMRDAITFRSNGAPFKISIDQPSKIQGSCALKFHARFQKVHKYANAFSWRAIKYLNLLLRFFMFNSSGRFSLSVHNVYEIVALPGDGEHKMENGGTGEC
ncbi:hypothetical protein CEXT_632781 [Caerostris extrusa]|uniref:Uncharacterized protein n=1 Tax=Caerostris extrusa TaxID=172846 RepID=A0AAV4MF56_CAEEX|nr:hypothetical protein CEXT_632781 [Caerostris extrusa]